MSDKKSSGYFKKTVVFSISLLLLFIGAYFGYKQLNSDTVEYYEYVDTLNAEEKDKEFIQAFVPIVDSTEEYIVLSDTNELNIAVDNGAGKAIKQIYNGRRINIAVTGVDSRLGTNTRHADANHIISLLIDSGKIELFAIPRDTYVDCGYDDTTGLNKLTVLRASSGRQRYLNEIARIARLDKIHYWVEFGFSQAMGLIELLGYNNPKSTLRVLRSRQGLGGDDYQRVYNQSQFIRQTILRHFHKFDGQMGALLMRAGLALVETNLTFDIVNSLYEKLKSKGFPQSASDVKIFVRPPVPINYKVYDFTDEETIAELKEKIDKYYRYQQRKSEIEQMSSNPDPSVILQRAINRASLDTSRNPQSAINIIKPYFDQRAWFQIDDIDERIKIRNTMADILINAYNKRKKYNEALMIKDLIEIEDKFYEQKKNIQ